MVIRMRRVPGLAELVAQIVRSDRGPVILGVYLLALSRLGPVMDQVGRSQVLRNGKHVELADQLIPQVLPVALKLELDFNQSTGGIATVFQPFGLKALDQVAHSGQAIACQDHEQLTVTGHHRGQLCVGRSGQLDGVLKRPVDTGHQAGDGVAVPPVFAVGVEVGGKLAVFDCARPRSHYPSSSI